MSSSITIRRSEVPNYLHKSELYLSLDETEDEFSVPSDCMKMNTRVQSLADLRNMLLTMRYWILKLFPSEVVQFLIVSRLLGITRTLYEFDAVFPRVRNLVKSIHEQGISQTCNLAAKYGRLDFLEHCAKKKLVLGIQTLQIAAENGRVHCLTYCYNFLSNNGHVGLEYQDWSELVRRGHFECVPFLVEKGVPAITFLTFALNIYTNNFTSTAGYPQLWRKLLELVSCN